MYATSIVSRENRYYLLETFLNVDGLTLFYHKAVFNVYVLSFLLLP